MQPYVNASQTFTQKQKLTFKMAGIATSHGRDAMFLHVEDLKAGANAICTFVWSYVAACIKDRNFVAPKLVLQCDNCNQNKNRWLLAMMSLMVQHDFFKEVELLFSFPYHGHCLVRALSSATHCDACVIAWLNVLSTVGNHDRICSRCANLYCVHAHQAG